MTKSMSVGRHGSLSEVLDNQGVGAIHRLLGPIFRLDPRNRLWLLGLLMPALTLYSVLLATPLTFIIENAIGSPAERETLLRTLSSETYQSLMLRTLQIALISTLICIILGFPLAYLLWRSRPRTRAVLLLAVLFPYWTSVLVRAYGWQVVLQRGGPGTRLLEALGLVPSGVVLSRSRFGLYVALVQILLPYLVLPVAATLTRIDWQLVEAAMSSGAHPLAAVFTVVVPLSAPGIAVGSIMVFGIASGSFVIPVLLGGLGDQMFAQMIAIQTTETLNWARASALSLVLVVLSLVFLAAITIAGRSQRLYRE